MNCQRFEDAEAFLRHAGRVLRGHAIDDNVMLGIAARLLDDGAAGCAMFSNADNPTTNASYRRIGYNQHGTYREYDFAPNEAG